MGVTFHVSKEMNHINTYFVPPIAREVSTAIGLRCSRKCASAVHSGCLQMALVMGLMIWKEGRYEWSATHCSLSDVVCAGVNWDGLIIWPILLLHRLRHLAYLWRCRRVPERYAAEILGGYTCTPSSLINRAFKQPRKHDHVQTDAWIPPKGAVPKRNLCRSKTIIGTYIWYWILQHIKLWAVCGQAKRRAAWSQRNCTSVVRDCGWNSILSLLLRTCKVGFWRICG